MAKRALCPVCYGLIPVLVRRGAKRIASHWSKRLVSRDGVTWRRVRTRKCQGTYLLVE